jgi:hypothetical protein
MPPMRLPLGQLPVHAMPFFQTPRSGQQINRPPHKSRNCKVVEMAEVPDAERAEKKKFKKNKKTAKIMRERGL